LFVCLCSVRLLTVEISRNRLSAGRTKRVCIYFGCILILLLVCMLGLFCRKWSVDLLLYTSLCTLCWWVYHSCVEYNRENFIQNVSYATKSLWMVDEETGELWFHLSQNLECKDSLSAWLLNLKQVEKGEKAIYDDDVHNRRPLHYLVMYKEKSRLKRHDNERERERTSWGELNRITMVLKLILNFIGNESSESILLLKLKPTYSRISCRQIRRRPLPFLPVIIIP